MDREITTHGDKNRCILINAYPSNNPINQWQEKMKNRKISRREFITTVATAASAVVIVSCAPGKNTTTAGEMQSEETASPGDAPQTREPGRELKLLIVYDSVYGNTAKIAEALIEGSGIDRESKVYKATEAALSDLENIDLLLVGSPTHGGTFTEPVKNFLGAIPAQGLQGMKAAAFDTSFDKETQKGLAKFAIGMLGVAAPKIGEELSEKGATVVAAETFIVLDSEGPLQEGEVERAQGWVNELISAL